MEQELEEHKENLRELQEEQSKLRSLLAHPGFKYLKEVLEAQVKTRVDGILLTVLPGIDATLKQEYEKGEAAGIQFATCFPAVRLEIVENQIEELLKKEGEGNANDADAGE